VSFAATILCVASQRVFIVVSVYFVMTQSGNFWIHPRKHTHVSFTKLQNGFRFSLSDELYSGSWRSLFNRKPWRKFDSFLI